MGRETLTEEKKDIPEWAVQKGKEKRCRRCWGLLSKYETEVGELKWWCYRCDADRAPAWEIPEENGLP